MISMLWAILDRPGRSQLRRTISAFTAAAALQGIAFALLVPVLDALFHHQWARAWTWVAVMGASLIAHHIALVYGSLSGYDLSCRLLKILLQRLGDHVARLPLGWFGSHRTGPLGRMVSKGSIDISAAPAHLVGTLITAAVTPATVMLVMLVLDWRLGIALLVGISAIAAATRLLAAVVDRGEHGYDSSIADGSARVIEFALNQPVLRVFGRTVHGNRLVDDALDRQKRAQRRLTVTGFAGMSIVLLALQALLTAVLAVAVHRTLGGALNPATMIALLILAVRFIEPLLTAGELTGTLRLARGSLTRVLTLLDVPTLPEPAHPAGARDSSVEFRSVTFGYDDGPPVLCDVSFTAPPRSLTAIVGPSGSGKTTVLRLIARFYDVPESGSGDVLVGGQGVRDLGTEGLIAGIGIVFQDVYLFEGTLRENVLMSRPDASETELQDAAGLARVDDIVRRLPNGWDTRIGEAGSTLSGGEKQRVSIARALLKDASIVLLDEATAALDPHNETAVQQALTALAANRTVIVIAHRLQTVVAADQILVLDGGRIAERGTHAELIENGGRYRDFWEQRTTAAGWRLSARD